MSTLPIRSIIVSCRVAAGSSSSCRRRSPILAQHRLKSNVSSDEIVVTQHSSRSSSLNGSTVIHNDEATVLVDDLLMRTSEMMMMKKGRVGSHHHVVAYSGGVDSSLVAALVHRVFSQHQSSSGGGSVRAVLGISNAVPQSQIHTARVVASYIGMPLTEIPTKEGEDDAYKRNDGYACYVCKNHLYSTLEAVAMHVANTNEEIKVRQNQRLRRQRHDHQYTTSSVNADTVVDDDDFNDESYNTSGDVILYNGTNADDLHDPTRLGLVAASNFAVRSPLSHITKVDVRRAAKYLGLPNWNAAASPCLRSRLAMGVEATSAHLKAVEDAECFVREVLGLDDTANVRVRMLSGGRAMVELDDSFFVGVDDNNENWVVRTLHEHGFEDQLRNRGFTSLAGVRQFRTGSVAAVPTKGKDGLPLVSSVY